jgi:hypothetical protein
MVKGGQKRARVLKTKPTIESEEKKIALMKAELHYFKGLSIFFTIMMLCLFIAFGSLFGAMYYETKLMRISMDRVLGDALPKIVVSDGLGDATGIVPVESDWLSFEKYDVKAFFPKNWTYLDKPYQKQIHFYSDGILREANSTATGDLIVSFTATDNYANRGKREVALVGDRLGYVYADDNGGEAYEVIVVKMSTGYAELRFHLKSGGKEVITMEQESGIREKFQFLK